MANQGRFHPIAGGNVVPGTGKNGSYEIPYLQEGSKDIISAVAGRSFHFQVGTNYVQEVQYEHPYLKVEEADPYIKIEEPHQYLKPDELNQKTPASLAISNTRQFATTNMENNISQPHFMAISNKLEKAKCPKTTFIIGASLLIIFGLAVGGIILIFQEKVRLDETDKKNSDLVAELQEKNQNLLKTFAAVKAEIKELHKNDGKFNETFWDTLSAIKRRAKAPSSCSELKDLYGVEESGIYRMKQMDSNDLAYSYCDFKLRTGNYTCEYLMKKLRTDLSNAYFWIRKNRNAKPNFKHCVKSSSSCKELMRASGRASGGVFTTHPNSSSLSKQIYCDSDGWTVLQRRLNGSVDFYRGWDEYVEGFGDLNGEFWLGLETIYQLTKDGDFVLRVDLGDFYGNTAYAEYCHFTISSASDGYRLNVSSYSGNAGDSLYYHSGMRFSTKDRGDTYCSTLFKGAWWYNNCQLGNLNGVYISAVANNTNGIVWYTWKNDWQDLKFSEMKFKKKYI